MFLEGRTLEKATTLKIKEARDFLTGMVNPEAQDDKGVLLGDTKETMEEEPQAILQEEGHVGKVIEVKLQTDGVTCMMTTK